MLKPRSFGPTPTLVRFGSYVGRRTARRRNIGSPVDDTGQSAGPQDSMRFTQDTDRILDVENIEEHGIAHTRIRTTTPVLNEVPLFGHNVRAAGLGRLTGQACNETRFDIERIDSPRDQFCRRECKRAVSTSELNGITNRVSTVELLQDTLGFEEGVPIRFIRHSAFATLHVLTHLPDCSGVGYFFPFLGSSAGFR